MDIKSSVHQIQITSEECYDIACWIYSSLEHSIKTHYVKHPEAYPHVYNFHKATLEEMLVKKD